MKNLNETIYIFDVDGTLTEPRKKVTKIFEQQFLKWVRGKRAIIATGSDFKKTKVPILLNTSFNLSNEPLVETQKEAIDVFNRSDIDVLYFPEIKEEIKK